MKVNDDHSSCMNALNSANFREQQFKKGFFAAVKTREEQ